VQVSGFGWLRITTPQCTFNCLIHTCTYTASAGVVAFPNVSAIRFSSSVLCFPLSTRVYLAHAEGRGCPARVLRGCCDTACAVSFTCMDMQLRKSRSTFAAHPPTLRGSFERTGRTDWVHWISVQAARAFAHTFGLRPQLPPLPAVGSSKNTRSSKNDFGF
jgi:hypothetical protein